MPQTVPPASHPLVDTFVDAQTGWSTNHRVNAVSVLNRWHQWCDDHDVELLEATTKDCTTFIRERGTVVAKSTNIKDYQFLKWLYAWLDEEGELAGRNPMRGVSGPGEAKHDPRNTPDVDPADYDRLMASFDKRRTLDCRDAAICSLMYRSGLRRSEVARADIDRLDLRGQVIEVYGKNGEWVPVPLAKETCQLLARYLRRRGDDGSPALFLGSKTAARDGRLDPTGISEMLGRRGRRLGIHLPAHAFRRGMAIQLKKQGYNDSTVQAIGRWADLETMIRYQRNAAMALAAAEFHAKDSTARPPRRLRAV